MAKKKTGTPMVGSPSLDAGRGAQLLRQQIEKAKSVLTAPALDRPAYESLYTTVSGLLTRAFGSDSPEERGVPSKNGYTKLARFAQNPAEVDQIIRDYIRDNLIPYLEGVLPLLEVDGTEAATPAEASNNVAAAPSVTPPLDWLLQVLRRFDTAAHFLASRPRAEKAAKPFRIEDEYDVQDLLYAILKPSIPDLEREDPVGKTSGDSGRVDLCTAELGTVVELKFVDSVSRAKEVAKECRERVGVYHKWPYLKHLAFFIYDPQRKMPDPDNFIAGFPATVVWGPKAFGMSAIVSPWQAGARSAIISTPVRPEPNPAQTAEEGLVVSIGAPDYVKQLHCVAVFATAQNLSARPTTIHDVTIAINGKTYSAINPIRGFSYAGVSWLGAPPLRLDPWDVASGAWYFGRSVDGGEGIDLSSETKALLRIRAAGVPDMTGEVTIRPPP
jgi:hypothetical protein